MPLTSNAMSASLPSLSWVSPVSVSVSAASTVSVLVLRRHHHLNFSHRQLPPRLTLSSVAQGGRLSIGPPTPIQTPMQRFSSCTCTCPQHHRQHHPPRIPHIPIPSFLLVPPTSTIPASRAFSHSSTHLFPPAARRSPPPKTETRPLSDASRAHLLSAASADPRSAAASASLVKDGDWLCSKCHFLNFASRSSCWRCAHVPLSPAQRDPIRTSKIEPVVVGMRAATVLGKQVVLVFIEMPLSATAQEQVQEQVQEQEQDEHEWACCSSDCTSAHNHHHHHNVTVKNDPGLVTADTQPQPPIAELTDTLFQSLKLSPSPIAQTLKHAHSTGSLALLTGDWICPSCSVVNYAFRDTCFKCDHDALDAHVPGRRLVVLPRQMMLTSSNTLNSKSVLRALAKLQGLWQGSLAKGKSTVGPLWACTNCLYVNRWGAHVCRKCGHDRDGWSRTVYRTAVGGEQQQVAPVPVEGYVWVDRGRAEQVLLPEQEQQHEEEEAYGEDEGQELVPKVDLTGRDKARDKAAVAKANRGWKRREEGAAQRDGDQDEWECD